MNNTHYFAFRGKIVLYLLATLVIFQSCATKEKFQTSAVVPAARGEIKVKKDKNDNYRISVSLSNLAEPGRLQPPKKTYVIWMVTSKDNYTKNIGQINSSTGFLSGKLRASFNTVTAFKPIKVFISAEDDGNTQYPGNLIVLETNRF